MTTERSELPPDPERPWLAEIEWRDAPGRARFCALAHGAERRDAAVVAESAWLTWPPEDDGDLDALAQGVRDVEQRLLAAGWRQIEPGGAWYAKRFAWAGAREPDGEPLPATEPDDDGSAEHHPAEHVNGEVAAAAVAPAGREAPRWRWRCEIAWDAGYINARFVAMAFAPGAERPRPVAATPRVRSRFRDEPNAGSAEHERAVQALESALLAAGWEPAGRGPRWYEQRFVWRRPGRPPQRLDVQMPPPRREAVAQVWRCEIGWKPGFVSSRFVALAYEPGRRRALEVGESAPLRWRKDDPDPDVAEHPEAVRTLEVALLEAGWEPAGQGSEWYSERFVWRRGGRPPDHVDPAVAEARPPG